MDFQQGKQQDRMIPRMTEYGSGSGSGIQICIDVKSRIRICLEVMQSAFLSGQKKEYQYCDFNVGGPKYSRPTIKVKTNENLSVLKENIFISDFISYPELSGCLG
jgi:hypothetical protein